MSFVLILAMHGLVVTLNFPSLEMCLADQHRAEAGEVRIIRDCEGTWR